MRVQELMGALANIQQLSYNGQACVRMVICSRKCLGWGLNGAPHVRVAALPEEAARQLLVNLSGESTHWYMGQAATMVAICGCNALAVSLIAGFLRSGRCTPEVCPANLHPFLGRPA